MTQKLPSNFSFSDFPTSPGVYLMKNGKEKILYVGKAKNLRSRIKSYFMPSGDGRTMIPYLTRQVEKIETIVVPTEKEALILENTLIKKHQPKYNALLKDDKTFLSLMLNTSHQYPMLKVVRVKGKCPQKDAYFGPYTNPYAARQTLELMRTLFPLRQCSDHELKNRSRPCILYDLKKCLAPCCHKCTDEEYEALTQEAMTFLKGKDKKIVARLESEMKEASNTLDFERAGRLCQLLESIKETIEKPVFKTQKKDLDVIGLARRADLIVITRQEYREGRLAVSKEMRFKSVIQETGSVLSSFLLQHYERKSGPPKEILLPTTLHDASLLSELIGRKLEVPKLGMRKRLVEIATLNAETTLDRMKEENMEEVLLNLEELLKLTHYPERIECVDQSHLSGSNPVSAIVTYINGNKETKAYRTYKLKSEDDYGGLEEVLRRRFRKPETLPDLLLIDGGKGHLSTTLKVLSELNISSVDVVAIAKEEGRHDKGMTGERCFLPHSKEPVSFSAYSKELFFLQRIRDEAHRFVIGFQKKRRKKKQFSSELDHLEGIGPIKKKRLLTHFGSVKRIKEATEQQWSEVKGITQKDLATLKLWQQT